MQQKPLPVVTYDTRRYEEDMAARGWLKSDLARAANISDMTVIRFLRGQHHNARTAKKLADALGRPLHRYQRVTRRQAVA